MIGALVALLCSAAPAERSVVVYPQQLLPLSFDHASHLRDGADCLTCHDQVRRSDRARDWNIPKHPECETCHDIEAARQGQQTWPVSSCRTCHPGFDETAMQSPAALVMPSPNIIFSHRAHVGRKTACSVCHSTVSNVQLSTRAELPKMATCLTCHDGKAASADCSTCHPTQPGGLLQQSFASGTLRPAAGNPMGLDHGSRFDFAHGTRAALSPSSCMACHTQRQCEQCHDSLTKPLAIHPGDFITTHPAAIRGDVMRCESCHRLQSFCAACHERVGIGMDASPLLLARNVRVHRDFEAWSGRGPQIGPGNHGVAAARDLGQCISCHRQESCLQCHTSRDLAPREFNVNPHPQGFIAQCRSLATRNDRPCLQCHQTSALSQWGCL